MTVVKPGEKMPDPDYEKIRESIRLAEQGINDGRVSPIAPHRNPGSLVFQIWFDGQMVKETLPSIEDAAGVGARDGAISAIALDAGKTVELRIFDGDTGLWIYTRRMEPK